MASTSRSAPAGGAIPGPRRARERVVVAMSGGVDSSVAAALLVERGYEVIGLALKLWDYGDRSDDALGSCCSPDDLYDARRVADALDIPFYVSNAQALFASEVVGRFTDDYIRGATPNPCVRCNDKVKFARLFQLSAGLGARYLATGHYARVIQGDDGGARLQEARDISKDQSYFLFTLSQAQLQGLLFPLGDMTKAQVREAAASRGLPTASKHESMEICFVAGRRYADFVEERVDVADLPPEGPIVDLTGTPVGTHRGVHHYTIGQRRGLGLPGGHDPLYVVGIDGDRVIVGPEAALWQRGLVASGVSWTRGAPPPRGAKMEARVRHRGARTGARIAKIEEGQVFIELTEPQRAISPGQAVVLYDGDELLGGGWIQGPWPAASHASPARDSDGVGEARCGTA